MPKHEAGSAKALANRMKSVGLQRLRWYCQMCEKQCRDENGFKCHTSSESHLRQMRIFAENSGSFLDQFSSEFEKGFMRILSHRHGTKRVPANIVYQEYIADKQHTHMNATTWTTLTGFCMYLGKTGKAIVDETEKGWFIQFVDRDPKMLARQEAAANRQKAEIDEEERRNRVIQAQIEEAEKRIAESGGQSDQDKDNSLHRSKEDDKVALSLGPSIVQKKKPAAVLKAAFSTEDEDDELGYNESTALPQKHVKSLDFLIREDQSRKRGNNEGEYPPAKRQLSSTDNNWLVRGIIVKVVSKVLEKGKYYKAKGKILRPLDDVTAEMMIEDTKIVVHKSDVETVIPKVGGLVMILKGNEKGRKATVEKINVDDYNCDIRLVGDKVSSMKGVDYEDISKLAEN